MTLDTGGKICNQCMVSEGIAMCYGCQQSFCTEHFNKHRLHLSQQMEDLSQKQKLFQQDLNRDKFEHTLLSSIDSWERKSMRKIQDIAEKARNELHQLMEKIKNEIQISLNHINEQVQSSKKADNYTELDFSRWTKQLEELRNLLEKPSTISIIEDEQPSSSIRTIKVIDKPSTSYSSLQLEKNQSLVQKSIDSIQEHFVLMFGSCKLSEEDHVATHSSYRAGLSQITGINQYSFGKHSIQFLIENKGNKNMFIGIISSSHKVISPTFDYSVHGWWNLDHFIVNGETKGGDNNELIQTGDKITLITDCDNQEIQLEHHSTGRHVCLPVKLEVCPFPWKILIRLLAEGDSIRILGE
jgi:hypothetical protein